MSSEKITHTQINDQYTQTERLLCQMSLKHLATKYIIPTLKRNMWSEDLHKECYQLIKNNDECLILLPRGFCKTTFFTEAMAVQDILNNQNIHMAIVSHSHRKAVEILDNIKQYLRIPALIKYFPEILYDNIPMSVVWKVDAIRVKQTKTVGNTIEVTGIDQDITGSHYDLIDFDDVVQKKNSNTPDNIKKVKKKFAAYSPILKPGGRKRIKGTRYKLDDLYGDLLKLGIPNIIKEVEDEDGNLLDPNILNREQFQEKKKKMVALDGKSFFVSQYYNKCIASEDVQFKTEWLKFYDDLPKINVIYIICDPAISKTRRSDECVVSLIGQAEDGMLYVISSEGKKEDVELSAFRIYDAWKFWHQKVIVKVGIETAGYQAALSQWVNKVQQDKGVFFDIEELKPRARPKEGRIKNLVPYFKNDRIRLNRSCKALEEQLLYYGAMIHEDHVDTLAYVTDLLDEVNQFMIINFADENVEALFE